MRLDEAFVADSLVAFLGGPSVVSASDGEDPPDLYLSFTDSCVGVEVTRLSQFTIEPNGLMGNRATQDSFGLRLLNEINSKLGPSLPDDVSFLVGIELPVSNAARFRKGLLDWVAEVVLNPLADAQYDRLIEGSKASISVIPARPTGEKIVGFVVAKNSTADILLNARLALADRIGVKNELCARLRKPIWLALLNDYWLADAQTFAIAARQIKATHCFERVFLVSGSGEVSEFMAAENLRDEDSRSRA